MISSWRSFVCIAILALASAEGHSSPAQPAQTISIRVRQVGDICIGNCANYEVIVHSDGRVQTRDIRFEGTSERSRWKFHITPAEYARFVALIAPARPHGEWRENDACERWGRANSPDWHPDTPQIEVRWAGFGQPSLLVGCDIGDNRSEAIAKALRSIRIRLGSGAHETESEQAED